MMKARVTLLSVLCTGAVLILLWWTRLRVDSDSNQVEQRAPAVRQPPAPNPVPSRGDARDNASALSPQSEVVPDTSNAIITSDGIEAYTELLSSVEQAEVSRVTHTAAHFDHAGQFYREYVIAAPRAEESAKVMEELSDLSKKFPGEEYAYLRDAIHAFFDYNEQFMIVRFVHKFSQNGGEWIRWLDVMDADGVTAMDDENGHPRYFRPAGTDMPEFKSTRRTERYSALADIHAAENEAIMEAAANEFRKQPHPQPERKESSIAPPTGTLENPAG